MIINDNIAALNTYNALSKNTTAMNNALAELSSGKQINSAADDASGLTISEQMQGQVNGLNQANNNAQDGVSLIQTAEGGLNETTSILQRMRELAVQSSNGTNTTSDRTAMQDEIGQLNSELTNIAGTTQFNTKTLLSGAFASVGSGGNGGITLQIGANSGQNMTITISSMSASGLGVSGISLTTATGAMAAITTIDDALSGVSAQNSMLGAYQNRLTYTSDNLSTSSQNLDAANAQLVDVDMAKEMSEYTKDSILVQAATSMLAQAQQEPQSVLKLLG